MLLMPISKMFLTSTRPAASLAHTVPAFLSPVALLLFLPRLPSFTRLDSDTPTRKLTWTKASVRFGARQTCLQLDGRRARLSEPRAIDHAMPAVVAATSGCNLI